MSGSGGWPGSCRKLRFRVVEALVAPPPLLPAAADVAATSLDFDEPPQALTSKANVSGATRTTKGRRLAGDVRMFLLMKDRSVGSKSPTGQAFRGRCGRRRCRPIEGLRSRGLSAPGDAWRSPSVLL